MLKTVRHNDDIVGILRGRLRRLDNSSFNLICEMFLCSNFDSNLIPSFLDHATLSNGVFVMPNSSRALSCQTVLEGCCSRTVWHDFEGCCSRTVWHDCNISYV